MTDKSVLREDLRRLRREHVGAIPETMRALVFHRPPAPLMELIGDNAIIGLYQATTHEAPTSGYAGFFLERGHTLALPRFSGRSTPMQFALFTDPWHQSDCETGPFGHMQPVPQADTVTPDIVFVPLLGFTDEGGRLGQGGGHYDRWLAAHPDVTAIGLAWDIQRVESLPLEDHDMSLSAIVTPTRLFGPFA